MVVSDFLEPGTVAWRELAGAVASGSRNAPTKSLRGPRGGRHPSAPAYERQDRHAAAPDWERPLRRLAVRHQVLAVEVVDPREGLLPDIGVVDLVDPETGDTLEVDTGRASTREAFAAAAAAHREKVRTVLRRAGVGHLVLRTDSDWVADTARFVLTHRVHAHQLHAVRRGA